VTIDQGDLNYSRYRVVMCAITPLMTIVQEWILCYNAVRTTLPRCSALIFRKWQNRDIDVYLGFEAYPPV
jgi:hypothetical protein